MKLAGETQAELVKWGALAVGALLLVGYLRGQAASLLNSAGAWVESSVNAVLSDVKGQAGHAIPDYSQANSRNTAPLDAYFQAKGNTVATRNAARAAGWTDGEISLSIIYLANQDGALWN